MYSCPLETFPAASPTSKAGAPGRWLGWANRVWFLAFWLIGCSPLVAQYDWAKKMFKEFDHDFGVVVKGETVEHRFEVENIYQEDLQIASVSSSCGCTEVSLEKTLLKTWEKTAVVAKFNTLAYAGDRKARITVVFAKPYYAVVTLDVKGRIRTDTVVTPGSVDFGTVYNLAQQNRTVSVTRYGNPRWSIKNVLSTYPHVAVALKEVERNNQRVTYQLTARLKDTADFGVLQNELIIIASENGNDEFRLPVPLVANIAKPLQITPDILNISNVAPGDTITKKIILKAEQPFKVLDVTSPNKSFTVSAERDAKKVHVVSVKYVVENSGSEVESELNFVTDLPAQNAAKLKVIVSVNQNAAK